MMYPVACTIASNNYLAYARVFARSFLAHHPGGAVWTLVVDRPAPEVDYAAEPFQAVFAHELGIPAFGNFAFRYSILELNTAVKPYFLRYLFDRLSCRSVCYFDPDILVTDSLAPLYEALERSDVLLTPHILQGIDDERYPGEREFLLSGIFNLGFLGIAHNDRTPPFLDWWQERLHRDCVHRVDQGLFVDQKWMDFAPAFLDRVEVVRDPGYNVAYWNLIHRRVTGDGGRYSIGEHPLRFFHFSGFQIEAIEEVSKYQNRFTLDDRPDVRPLFEGYREALLREGARELSRLPYAYGSFSDGSPVPSLARRILQNLDPGGEIWEDPFDIDADDGYRAWLLETVTTASGARLPRLALALWDERPDVQRVFPSPLSSDDPDFAFWFLDEVERSPDLEAAFAEKTAASFRALERSRGPRRGAAGTDPRRRNVFGKMVARVHPASWAIDRGLARWWSSPADLGLRDGVRVSRVSMLIHDQRADLKATFPEPLGASRKAFARWFVTYGRLEYSLPRRVIGPVLRSLPLRDQMYARLWWLRHAGPRRRATSVRETSALPAEAKAGESDARAAAGEGGLVKHAESASTVTVVGWSASPTGVGEACRGTLAALEAERVPYSLVSLNHPELDRDEPLLEARRAATDPRSPVLLCHVNADMMATVHRELPRSVEAGKYVIGYWFWELSHFPLALTEGFRFVDEVWAPSRFCQRAFSAVAPCEVRWVPPGVRLPVAGAFDRFELDVPRDAFLFFFAFDALSVPERKNPAGLLKAFARVVEELGRDRVHLLVKISHTEGNPGLVKRLRGLAEDLPVTVLAKALKRTTLQGLFAASDAYVSLHRSEGLGLPLIESMFLGKPVIATGYGGCTDFVDETTSWPVRYRLESLSQAHGPYPAGAVWSDPDVEHAAEQMLEVVLSPELRRTKTAAARRRVEELYAPRPAGERFRAELDRVVGLVEGERPSAPRVRRRLVS